MKKIITLLLVLVLLLPLMPMQKADAVAVKPYYGIGSSDFNRLKFPNLEGRLSINVGVENGEVYLSASGAGKDLNKIASLIKSALDRYPDGMRTFVLHNISSVFQLQKDTIYFEEGVEKLKKIFTEFIKIYAEIGGKLDGIVLDVEYVETYSWYLYSKQYTKDNPDVYKNIVANPLYQTTVRPMLVEREFKFYENSALPEIWSAYPKLKGEEAQKYAISQTVWDTVMRIRLNNYMTEAIYKPLAQYMPNVPVYDYQSRNSYAWLKDLSDKGEHKYVAGNSVAVGVTSHHNTYGSRLSDDFFTANGQPVYKTPVAYNGAEFAATPFNRILWDVNLMKNMYKAANGNVSITVAEYDYSPNKTGTPSNTPFYTESIFHIGLLDPAPFSIYMYDKEFTTQEYNARAQVLQDIMAELTRVAGYADREPILVPATWNSSFLLSGIYANGRNLWRLTPDTTKVSLEAFKVAGKDPTFSVNGQTITFPQGKIIADGQIGVVGTCGYWIETPKDIAPIVTNDTDRYSKYPSFAEGFEGYDNGITFNNANAKPILCWQVSGTAPVVKTAGNGKALALTGTTTVSNEKLPQNITAGDNYAKEQAWEVSVTLPASFSGEVKLLTCGDGGIRIADGKLYYDENGTYKEMTGATLSAGQKYTLKREVNFRNSFLCDYTVCDSAGKVIGQARAVPMKKITLPVTKIGISCTNVTGEVLVDDYKLYPKGINTDLEVYNAKSGIQQKDITQKNTTDVAYRFSWLNGSDRIAVGNVMATFYDAAGKQLSQQSVGRVTMKPGWDAVETGIVQVPQGQSVVLSLEIATDEPQPSVPTQPTTPVPGTQPVTVPSGGEPVATVPATVAPTENAAPSAAPTTDAKPAEITEKISDKEEPAEKAASDSTLLWVVIGVVALAAAGAAVYFLYFKKKSRK